jgi:small-conductance mechanosensitive channel
MDKESIAFGIILAVAVQGFYDILFYISQGKYVEEWASLTALSGTLAFLLIVLLWKGYFKPKQKTKQQNREERTKKLNSFQLSLLIFVVAIIVAYVFVLFLLPVTIDDTNVPTLVNGITTSMSIVVALGGAVVGIMFRSDIEKGDSEAKKFYFTALGLFIIALVYPWGSYLALTTKQFSFAVKYSFFGYLIALLVMVTVYAYTAKRWDKRNIEN